MKIDIIGLLISFSYALDCVESELIHVTTGHAKRVAYMSICIAQEMGISGNAIQDLAACALMHDNALTQYIAEEYHNEPFIASTKQPPRRIGLHCIYGEQNMRKYPFHTDMTNVILYHHEKADGTGPFEKKWNEVHLFARIIHMCDVLDGFFQADNYAEHVWENAKDFVKQHENTWFDSECVAALQRVAKEKYVGLLESGEFTNQLWEMLPRQKEEYSFEVLKDLTDIFAGITDYKSHFTSQHSIGVAKSAYRLSLFMGMDMDTAQKMYIAGALHDIGKITIKNDILEKPDKLTEKEYDSMKDHAWYTYKMLHQVAGFEEITRWAALHHERLDGSGYPFGYTAKDLGVQERMMACVDIFQALTEERPYKKGMAKEQAFAIMRDMAAKNWIDDEITEKLIDCYCTTV